jgi:hypothetical protein
LLAHFLAYLHVGLHGQPGADHVELYVGIHYETRRVGLNAALRAAPVEELRFQAVHHVELWVVLHAGLHARLRAGFHAVVFHAVFQAVRPAGLHARVRTAHRVGRSGVCATRLYSEHYVDHGAIVGGGNGRRDGRSGQRRADDDVGQTSSRT